MTLRFAAPTSPSPLVRYALVPNRVGVYLASDSSQCLEMGLPYTFAVQRAKESRQHSPIVDEPLLCSKCTGASYNPYRRG